MKLPARQRKPINPIVNAILWTVAAVLVIIAAIVNGWAAETMGVIMIVIALAVPVPRWIIYARYKRNSK